MRWYIRQLSRVCVAVKKAFSRMGAAITQVLLLGKALVITARGLYTSAAP